MKGRLLTTLSRLPLLLFTFITGFYFVLAWIPFTYHTFLKVELVGWLSLFAAWHTLIFVAVIAAAIAPIWRDIQNPRVRIPLLAFIGCAAVTSVVLAIKSPLANIANTPADFYYAAISFVPLAWLAAIDFRANSGRINWSKADGNVACDRILFEASIASALSVTAVSSAVALSLRHGSSGAVAQSLLLNIAGALVAFLILIFLRGLASLFAHRAIAEVVLFTLCVAASAAILLQRIVFNALSVTGIGPNVLSMWIGTAVAVYLIALSMRGHSGMEPLAGLSVGLRSFVPTFLNDAIAIAMLIVLVLVFGAGVVIYGGPFDYNFLFQRLSVVVVWAVTFAGFYALYERQVHSPHYGMLYGVSLAGLTAFLGWGHWAAAGVDSKTLYEFLARNTNISRSANVTAADLQIAPMPSPPAGNQPHVFIVVVDSLRPDYLSPYNPKVTFTPNIGRFGRESVVFRNAFTRYGATGLSEPAIWVGGSIIHQQYARPFYPMNSLQKLIQSENYRQYISVDTIVQEIIKPDPAITDIDADIANANYRACRSLSRLQELLDRDGKPAQPIFVYTQPQDIHVSVINRENRSVPGGEMYPGFDAAYAVRLKRVDGCFGTFIDYLKQHGLYERSIVVLTADHGDSLGEAGRFGHAYTLFPEVVRIPIIVHLPESIRASVKWDVNAAAFQTDVTPSLFYLLGHRPIQNDPVLGRPLFTHDLEEQKPYLRDSVLLASSYGPVWGILRANGRYLYIADGVNYTDYFFDLAADPAGAHNRITSSVREEYAGIMREQIGALSAFYHFSPYQ